MLEEAVCSFWRHLVVKIKSRPLTGFLLPHIVVTIIYTHMWLNFNRCLKQCSYSEMEVYGSSDNWRISCYESLQNGRGSLCPHGVLTAWPPRRCLQLYLLSEYCSRGHKYCAVKVKFHCSPDFSLYFCTKMNKLCFSLWNYINSSFAPQPHIAVLHWTFEETFLSALNAPLTQKI